MPLDVLDHVMIRLLVDLTDECETFTAGSLHEAWLLEESRCQILTEEGCLVEVFNREFAKLNFILK